MPKVLLSLVGIINPLVRELKETDYQFEDPWVVDHSKFERAFGANPTPLKDALAATIDWYRGRAESA